jgi:pimeloyl-ACP methyl ester carboxylesterase
LGADDAVVVGHDWGGWIAWSMPALQPVVTRAVAALGMAHPVPMRRAVRRQRSQATASRYIWGFQLPLRPERLLTRPGTVESLLRKGSGTSWPATAPDAAEIVTNYTAAMRVPFVAYAAMEYYRWAVRSTWRTDGRSFVERVDRPITVPVLQLQGELDPVVLPETASRSRDWVSGAYTYRELAGAGHFLPEEQPDVVSAELVGWLARLP